MKAASKFKSAVKKAKALYRTGRYASFSQAVKAAYKGKRVGATKFIERGESKNTAPRKVVRVNRTKSGTFKSMETITGLMSAVRRQLRTKIENAAGAVALATTKRSRKKAAKRLAELKKQYRKLGS